jgi:hypothetical protein
LLYKRGREMGLKRQDFGHQPRFYIYLVAKHSFFNHFATSTQERAAAHPQNQTPIIAGSVVAGIAVLALILGLVWLVLWKRKVVTSEPNATIAANREHGEFISPKQVWELHGVATAELGTSGYTGELHGHDRPTELYAQEKPTSFTNSSTNENSGLLR